MNEPRDEHRAESQDPPLDTPQQTPRAAAQSGLPDERPSGRRSTQAPEALAARPLEEPHPDRLSPDNPTYAEIIQAHSEALRSCADSYVDPGSRLTVLTAGFLARRGYCCESGCRHCPYVL
jgi:hypothetical protein